MQIANKLGMSLIVSLLFFKEGGLQRSKLSPTIEHMQTLAIVDVMETLMLQLNFYIWEDNKLWVWLKEQNVIFSPLSFLQTRNVIDVVPFGGTSSTLSYI